MKCPLASVLGEKRGPVSMRLDESRVGAVVGLLLGTLRGPGRLSGVDFRQWFKNPGTPS